MAYWRNGVQRQYADARGVQLFYLSRIMGTSVTQIDATYGHLVPDSEEYLRGLLDAYDVRNEIEDEGALSPSSGDGLFSHA